MYWRFLGSDPIRWNDGAVHTAGALHQLGKNHSRAFHMEEYLEKQATAIESTLQQLGGVCTSTFAGDACRVDIHTHHLKNVRSPSA